MMKTSYTLLVILGLLTFACTEHPYKNDGHNEVAIPDGLFDEQDTIAMPANDLPAIDVEESE